MSNEVKGTQLDKKNVPTANKQGKSRSIFIVWLLVLVSSFALGLSGFIYFQMIKMEASTNSIPSSLNQIEMKQGNLAKSLLLAEQENKKFQDQLATVLQQQAQLNKDFRLLASGQSNGSDDWTLAEIEHLLIISTQRLKLEGDVSMALAAMQAADDRLRDDDDLRLLSIRKQLSKDMNALKAVEKVDIAGLVLFLSDLVTRAVDLPLKQAKVKKDIAQVSNVAEEKSSKWAKLISSVWQELKGLVIISRRGEETLATLMPEQQYFLYQNLRLQLESARYAVLRRDTNNLHVSIEIISSWLDNYFDSSDESVANILDSLAQMASLELNPPLPDISSSLESLRAFMKEDQEPSNILQEQSSELER